MTFRVLKFGGTSVADPPAITTAAAIVASSRAECERVLVVVSALAGVTNALVAALEAATRRDGAAESSFRALHSRHRAVLAAVGRPPSALDAADALDAELEALRRRLEAVALLGRAPACVAAEVLAAGERMSVPIFAAALSAIDLRPTTIDATELLAVAGDPLDGDLDLEASRGLPGWEHLRAAPLTVVPGFLGGAAGEVRLLGRGGSDTSATAIGALGGADRVEIWTDVDGVFPEDPRLAPTALPFERLDYDDAERLARRGARVLHAKSIAPAREAGLEVRVLNTFRPRARGTRIRGVPAVRIERRVFAWGASL